MDHTQALEQMAAERYLLNELTPEARDAFEEHFFNCSDCALDLRTTAAFIDEAKAQLPSLVPSRTAGSATPPPRRWWFHAWRPVFVVPAFAALLLALGYQNLVTLPSLRGQAVQPQILAMATLHGATRGGSAPLLTVAPGAGLGISVDLAQEPGAAPAVSYGFSLSDAHGKQVWQRQLASSQAESSRVTVALPGAMLHNGAYTLAVTAIDAQGARTVLDSYPFQIARTN